MTTATGIEWTGHVWNPIVGCSVLSKGCTNCYAMSMAHRLGSMAATPHYHGLTRKVKGTVVWTGKVAAAPDATWLAPLKRRKPTTYFVNSMGDPFHEAVPDVLVDYMFAIMALCPQHIFQILTKRPERMRDFMAHILSRRLVGGQNWPTSPLEDAAFNIVEDMGLDGNVAATSAYEAWHDWPLPNVWLGTSVEDQASADARIPALLDTPAAIRFISAEPLLGPVDLTLDGLMYFDCADDCEYRFHDYTTGVTECRRCEDSFKTDDPGLDWVICGGEAGPGARPMHPDWARSLRDQCAAAGVPFFMKQMSAVTLDGAKADKTAIPDDLLIREVPNA
ncbi:MAG: phage Gp37/Gp68 family protein [Minwuia sp.]|nr:phage Gp37/Gp68 family protein [Minwuia sp.]